MFKENLLKIANANEKTHLLLDEKSAETFEKMTSFLLEYNKKTNLTAIRDENGVIFKHIVDSICVIPYIKDGDKVADIGCGGGFPSIPIAILKENANIVGFDSVKKKTDYVNACAEHLSLKNISALPERAEIIGKNPSFRESFDKVVSRALGRLVLISELCLPLVKVGGEFIAMKSVLADEELEEAKNIIKTLGGNVEKVEKYTLSDGNETIERALIIIKKIKNTPPQYPRNYSAIIKAIK